MLINSDKMIITSDIMKGIFLVILSALGHPAVKATFSKQTLHLLNTNYIAKHVIIFALLYFANDFTDNTNTHPLDTFKQTIVLWLLYIVISKQTLYFTIVNLSLLTILYMLYNYKDHYEINMKEGSQDEDYTKLLKENNKYITFTTYSLIVSCVIGFIYYYLKQKKERKQRFDHNKFIFGSKL